MLDRRPAPAHCCCDDGPACRVQGSFLDDDARSIDDLGLRPGEFLVRRLPDGALSCRCSGCKHQLCTHQLQVAFETRKKKKKKAAAAQPAGEAECVTPPSSPRQQWTSQGDGGRRRQPGAGIPGAGQPPPPLLASPGKLDSLLPGYLSRPNPSPVKGRLLPAPSSISEARMAPQTAGAEAASAAGAPVQQGAQPAAKRARSLLSLAAERYGGNAAGSIQVPEPPATQQLQHGTAPLAVCDPGAVAAPAAGTQHPSTNQRANLPGAALLAVPGQERQAASSDSGVGPAPTASAAAAVAHTAPRLRTAMRGAGSKRKQPASAAEPPAAAAAGRGSSAASPALAAGSGLLAVSDAELDAAAAALPLPPLAQHLEAAFVVLAQVHAFLTQQHIQVRCTSLFFRVWGGGCGCVPCPLRTSTPACLPSSRLFFAFSITLALSGPTAGHLGPPAAVGGRHAPAPAAHPGRLPPRGDGVPRAGCHAAARQVGAVGATAHWQGHCCPAPAQPGMRVSCSVTSHSVRPVGRAPPVLIPRLCLRIPATPQGGAPLLPRHLAHGGVVPAKGTSCGGGCCGCRGGSRRRAAAAAQPHAPAHRRRRHGACGGRGGGSSMRGGIWQRRCCSCCCCCI